VMRITGRQLFHNRGMEIAYPTLAIH
jgi:hypothetical protein